MRPRVLETAFGTLGERCRELKPAFLQVRAVRIGPRCTRHPRPRAKPRAIPKLVRQLQRSLVRFANSHTRRNTAKRRPGGPIEGTATSESVDFSPDGYLLGSYCIATAPEPNSSRLTSFKSTRFDSPANNVGPWPVTLGCTTNSYSSINPSSANACGSFTPPTNSPLPDSRLSC